MYNPMYNNFYPYQSLNMQAAARPSLIRGLSNSISKIKWGTILNNTQKTLNVINQAIPVYYQIKPIYNNAKTMFRVIGAMGKDTPTKEVNNQTTNTDKTLEQEKNISSNQPIFFI